MNISLIIPSRNNLKYVKFAYDSIRKHIGYDIEVILLDDASTDGTWDWMYNLSKSGANVKIYRNEGTERVGHTVLYDIGASLASNPIFGIFHADMVATPNYITNMIKHLRPGVVVSGTRIEPPLHPPGPEKFVENFGMEPELFEEDKFLKFVKEKEALHKDETTNGIFAPWIIHKSDFQAINGHDKRVFAPMELEDSDLFNRFLLKGYTLIQSRDAFVYHMTCRGSRFKDGVKILQEIPLNTGHVWKRAADSEEYLNLRQIKFREWWRKWHMDVLHDANMLPIVYPRYNIGFKVYNITHIDQIIGLEPWCDTLYIDWSESDIKEVVDKIQLTSKFDISKKIQHHRCGTSNDIVVKFDVTKFTQHHMEFIKNLPLILKDSGEVGVMQHDIFTLEIFKLKTYTETLIDADNPDYLSQLK